MRQKCSFFRRTGLLLTQCDEKAGQNGIVLGQKSEVLGKNFEVSATFQAVLGKSKNPRVMKCVGGDVDYCYPQITHIPADELDFRLVKLKI